MNSLPKLLSWLIVNSTQSQK